MRYIDPTLQAKILQAQQTLYNNNNPQMEMIVVRPNTAINHQRFWQESIVTAGVTAVCTSVAIRRTGRWGDTVYMAYVDNTGTLVVKSAPLRFPIRAMSWTTIETIAGCSACALEFEGRFVHVGRNVEFRTDSTPYLAYITTAGSLYVGLLGDSYESLAASGVTAVDMINGVSNTYDAQDQGFFVFYIVDGTVYYNTYADGAWEGQRAVAIAPANAVKIKAERTFDYRIVLQVTDNTGALYEVFTKMEATGWNSTEYLAFTNARVTQAELTQVYYHDFATTEYLSMSNVAVDAWNMSIYPPILLRAYNIATLVEDPENPGNYYDDYGYRVVFEFSECVKNAVDNPAQFKLVDAYNSTWYGQSVQQDNHGLTVTVTFNDFNNAGNDVTAVALGGVLSNGYVELEETETEFTAIGLVPTFVPAPELTALYNTDNRTIIMEFDRPIVSINSQSGFVVSGYEPYASPEGELIATNYGIDSIDYAVEQTNETVAIGDGTMTDTEYSGGSIVLGKDE